MTEKPAHPNSANLQFYHNLPTRGPKYQKPFATELANRTAANFLWRGVTGLFQLIRWEHGLTVSGSKIACTPPNREVLDDFATNTFQ